MLAPAGTPRDIVTKLRAEIVKALKTPEVQKRVDELDTDIIGNTPEAFAAQIANKRNKRAKVASDAGIKPAQSANIAIE